GGVWTLIFTQTLLLTDVPATHDSLVNFGTVSLEPENCYTEIFTQLIGDVDPSNDTATSHPIVIYDVLFELDVETPTSDNQCLGVEFDGTYFYITGGNSGTEPNKIYVIDTVGNLIWTIDQPAHATGWGWRNLCWDGAYAGPDRVDTLYSFYSSSLEKFGIDLNSGILNYYGSIPVPGISGRALAYMPESLWFFTAGGDSIYRFGEAHPALHQSTNTPWNTYGAAYDTDTAEGGWVWLHSQDDPWTGFDLQIEQFDPIEISFTGLYFGYVPTLTATGMAGGLCFHEGFRNADVLFAIVQGDPDCIVGIYMRPHISPSVEDLPTTETASVFGFAPDMPNPIKNHATLSYTTTTAGNVSLTIYDCAGRLIKTLVNTYQSAGTKTVYWNGKGENHRIVPNGIYFLRLEAEDKTDIRKVIFIR
ncbi:MAG: T9SS type A sorting domain-containing protein, partial [candidate division WOR-3 bacterium]